ncbi:helix-turn-helix domain-containing protein [Oharaeibacter diazotrophicus]|uniref:Helix-turn-helix domain-containing protein n=1 Tax=Oharaeibacter diazotrophicus TaxID=1920512 RepID=A0A4R6RPL9_9HYPH|nr:helix-turn-helix domain-containing protein [Oharaeibacter diazotrophicus]TDP88719.1 hypothetical protein EDD54_0015 [Oharaeibacter diazotrophicus]GLS79220.1 hypothetical protein GCM10007904_45580 [Oharaeibacter diazotrophicus]
MVERESRPPAPLHPNPAGKPPRPSLRQIAVTPDEVLAQHEPWTTLSTKQLAAVLGVDPGTVTVWRWRGVGPPCQGIRYGVTQLVQWLAERTGAPMSEEDVLRRYLTVRGMQDVNAITINQLWQVVEVLRG